MSSRRIIDHPVLGPLDPGEAVEFRWQGRAVDAIKGEPIAAALMAAGIVRLRTNVQGNGRGLFCAIGHCMECRVTVDGVSGVRACLTPVQGGEEVEP